MLPYFSGKESIGATLTRPPLICPGQRRLWKSRAPFYTHRNHEFASKIMVLQGYLQLSRMNSDRTHDEVIGKALDDRTALVHLHLQGKNSVGGEQVLWNGY